MRAVRILVQALAAGMEIPGIRRLSILRSWAALLLQVARYMVQELEVGMETTGIQRLSILPS
jgi:hypothetical protein